MWRSEFSLGLTFLYSFVFCLSFDQENCSPKNICSFELKINVLSSQFYGARDLRWVKKKKKILFLRNHISSHKLIISWEQNTILWEWFFKIDFTHVRTPSPYISSFIYFLYSRKILTEWCKSLCTDTDGALWLITCCRQCEVIIQADEEDTLYRVVTPSVSKGGKGKDFILLASRRKPCDSRYCKMTCWLF